MAEFDKGNVYKNIFSLNNQRQTKDFHAIFITVWETLVSATEQEKEMIGISIGKTEIKIFMFQVGRLAKHVTKLADQAR